MAPRVLKRPAATSRPRSSAAAAAILRRPAAPVLRRPSGAGGQASAKAISKKPSTSSASNTTGTIAERATKRRRNAVVDTPVKVDKPIKRAQIFRTFRIKMASGTQLQVPIPEGSHVGFLEEEVSKRLKVGFCFSLVGASGRRLDDTSAPLPDEEDLNVVVENPSELCPAAQRVLERVFSKGVEDPEVLQRLRLGRCRCLGKFPGSKWKQGGIQSAISDIESGDGDDRYDMYGSYFVHELTLITYGDKRLRFIGVINEGDADANTGMWGSIYLRPSLREVGIIRSEGDSESVWSVKDDSWYEPLVVPLPACVWNGVRASTSLKKHLTHALEIASSVDAEVLEGEQISRQHSAEGFDVD